MRQNQNEALRAGQHRLSKIAVIRRGGAWRLSWIEGVGHLKTAVLLRYDRVVRVTQAYTWRCIEPWRNGMICILIVIFLH